MKTLILVLMGLLVACNPVEPERRLCTVTLRIDHTAGLYARHQWYKYDDAEFPTAVATDDELNPLPDAAPGTVVTITIVGLDIKFRDTLIVKSDTIWTPQKGIL